MQLLLYVQGVWMKLSQIIFYKKTTQNGHFVTFYWKINNSCWKIYMLSWYLSNKIAIGINNSLDRDSEPGACTPHHVSVRSGENLDYRGHQAGLNAIGMSIDMSLKFAEDKIAHQPLTLFEIYRNLFSMISSYWDC